ncbi:MAG: DUF4340 domain-containing protein, partial [Candidatus Ratteibacteria bacterium]
KVKEFVEGKNEKECGLEKCEIIFKIKVKQNDYFLYLGKKKDDLYYAKNSEKPYIFLVENKIIKDIPEEIDDLRERKLFDINVSDVREIVIKKVKDEFKFVKEKENWYLENEKTKRISKDKIEEFLYGLKNIEIKDFIEYSEKKFKDYELYQPEIKISVSDNKNKIEIDFGKKTEKIIYCYYPKRKILFTIPSSDYDKINKDKDFFIEKEKR